MENIAEGLKSPSVNYSWKPLVTGALLVCIFLAVMINQNDTVSGSYGLVTNENHRDCNRSGGIATTIDEDPIEFEENKDNIYNSVLENRKLLNDWPPWTLTHYLQPWLSRKHKEPEKRPDDNLKLYRFPKVICLGVRKCGTSALTNFLGSHPKVVYGAREIHFFDSEKYQKGLKQYQSMLPRATSDQIVIDKSPRYFFSPYVPSRIWEWNRDIKLIVVVCDPVPRAYSGYHFDRGSRIRLRKNFKSFDDTITTSISDIEAIKKDPLGTLGYPTFHSFVRNMWNERTYQLGVLTHGMYSIHLKDWYNHFNTNQILIVDGEELLRDPSSVMKEVQTFLEIEQFLTKESFYFDEEKGFFCLVSEPCLKKAKGTTRKNGQTNMSPETREKLRRFYKPYNEELFKMLNRTFDWS